ncbi:hypothetical protein RhiLY_12265 [Ceratobasidium sp. AG-Ba]|nr:hypothetical protein RhiLY_12265 [Ceratobasidium sp. AG-Ba]
MASKTLSFYVTDLKQDATVMLIFDPFSGSDSEPFPFLDFYKVKFPVVWRVIKFRAGGRAKATVTYLPRLAFGHAQTNDDNVVTVAKWVELQSGDTAAATGKNRTTQSDGTRFIKVDADGEHFEPVLLCTGVRANSNVTTQFTPTLSAYVTRDYEKSQYLRGEVESEAIWVQNLNLLEEHTSWSFRDDEETGCFSIERT